MRRDVKELEKELTKVHAGAKQGFSMIKEELDGHKDSINANSHEIEMLSGQLSSIEGKLDKLSERLDELSMKTTQNPYANLRVKLNVREQEVFLVLYTSRKAMKLQDVAKLLGLTQQMVHETIFKLIAKGIPLLRKGTSAMYIMDKQFKELQAKQQIIHIDANVKRELAVTVEEE